MRMEFDGEHTLFGIYWYSKWQCGNDNGNDNDNDDDVDDDDDDGDLWIVWLSSFACVCHTKTDAIRQIIGYKYFTYKMQYEQFSHNECYHAFPLN